ncbi:PepSY domain-containing protein [Staphylococcus sp. EZ-P03]|uniref:PepSY domain-containing protein n=1 Tax=Staphylococcus sp. EZ-P03 TaxID=2282739 RepID=UPI000DF84CD8|nr:PepSY domain-containing protein [Staphylococcus sp. EZ-P03]
MIIKKMIKILLIVIICLLIVILGAIIYFKSGQTDITKQEAERIADERYDGKILSSGLNRDKTAYKIKLLDEGLHYDLEVDRKNGTIKNVHTEKIKKESKSKSKPDKKETSHKSSDSPPYISENEAKAIAQREVPGQFIYINLENDIKPPLYVVQQVVDDDEGAIVKINALNKSVVSVSWFEIEDNDDDMD